MKVRMFKVVFRSVSPTEEVFGVFDCMSDKDAINVTKRMKERAGLIGRYYCETSSGYQFMI